MATSKTLSMEQLNCEMFQIAIHFDQSTFNEKVFRKETDFAGEDITEGIFVTHHKNNHEHAHIEISLDGEDSSLKLIFHEGGLEGDLESGEVPIEDSTKAVARFFRKKKFEADLTAVYKFDERFEAIIKLNYPLHLTNDLLSDVVLSGHELEFTSNPEMNRVFLSAKNNAIIVILKGILDINLNKFNVYTEIKRIRQYAQAFVTKRG